MNKEIIKLISQALSVLEASIPIFNTGDRVLVQYPNITGNTKAFYLATVTDVKDNMVYFEYDYKKEKGELPYDSIYFIGKGVDDKYEGVIKERSVYKYVKSFFRDPSPKMVKKEDSASTTLEEEAKIHRSQKDIVNKEEVINQRKEQEVLDKKFKFYKDEILEYANRLVESHNFCKEEALELAKRTFNPQTMSKKDKKLLVPSKRF